MNTHKIALLGATGSIGGQVLELIDEFSDRFHLVAFAGGSNLARVQELHRRYPDAYAAIANPPQGASVPPGIGVGSEALTRAATESRADFVIVAISGAGSLMPTLAALEADKDVALASKEALVMGGELVMAAARQRGRWILPIDSEHSAVWQCRWGEDLTTISGIALTGSGGPFRELPLDQLRNVKLEDALKHPTWNMGPKITIDSATMMNKALEVIELHHLFDIPYEKIRVVIHPQSVVHSMIEFVDGSVKAQLSNPDMRIPISIVLGYPERLFRHPSPLRLEQMAALEFQEPDPARYPALALGFSAGRLGKTYPTVMNAANEAAVGMFVKGAIGFDRIVPLVERVLENHRPAAVDSLATLMDADGWARREAEQVARNLPATLKS